ncbi:hypothetical protein A3B45_03210 [Candidatus Daviesbacteria bacterium RIFCSPLOWO2_01_FULL_39_12]|uniref:Uncharacterized protein n=1 Tax=Candidatus Daviesbacteria bacterium RIFCSPLOWO2_01_FULL_39_12 TaxID=1797785 RepID=A0A1F5KSS7_9BACT|nr:MAG: hypothetical protein A3B45_03210 [Candidatus Daviesbacteria bacterium RIFCSPLOWO2_01_FULL_39_12]
MSKKEFFIILGLSVVVTFGVTIVEAMINPSYRQAGLPFKFGTYVLFGQASTNYLFLFLDIIFWFVVIWGIWKLFKMVLKR